VAVISKRDRGARARRHRRVRFEAGAWRSKGVLFKKFADIDVFEPESTPRDVDTFLPRCQGAGADVRGVNSRT